LTAVRFQDGGAIAAGSHFTANLASETVTNIAGPNVFLIRFENSSVTFIS
jgi:hypothetical protein